jgi:Tfp pilus assembly protein PilO
MDDETRAAFGRMERWFELSRAQHQEFRAEMRTEITGLRAEFRTFRDWATVAIAELRTQLRDVLARLDRLERQGNPFG